MGIADEIKITCRIANGDREAFKELFDFYYRPLCIYAINFLDSFDDAEDIVQNLFADFWIRYSKKKFEGSVRAYLFSSVRNNCVRLLNNARNRPLEDADAVLEAEEVFGFLENLDEEYRLLYNEIENLPSQSKKVFKAIIFDDMKYKDAADLLGISINTVKTHLSRSLRHLRKFHKVIIIMLLVK
jgi:RNA polymerase sigma-70 factor (ECF subfamily)